MTVFVDNRTLLDAFRRGDRGALATVYFHYIDDIAVVVRHGFSIPSSGARVRGAPDEQTERDLVQEVFVRAFGVRARDAYDGVRPYGAYLRRIARNLLTDRARAADHTIPLDDADDEPAMEPEAAESDAEWSAQRREATALHRLAGPELHRLVQLRFEQEMSQDQTADALGVSRRRVPLPSQGSSRGPCPSTEGLSYS